MRTTRVGKLQNIYVTPVPDKKSTTLLPLIEEMTRGSRTRIWTDGAPHNTGLAGKYRWESVKHKDEWVTDEGVHTNTVEGANSMLKRRLVSEGGSLGRSDDTREMRLGAIGQKCNGSLRVHEKTPLIQILQDIQVYCKDVLLC